MDRKFVPGRRGQISVADAIIEVIFPDGKQPTPLPLAKITEKCRGILGYQVAESTIRSTLYSREDLFKRVSEKSARPAIYSVTDKVVEAKE